MKKLRLKSMCVTVFFQVIFIRKMTPYFGLKFSAFDTCKYFFKFEVKI